MTLGSIIRGMKSATRVVPIFYHNDKGRLQVIVLTPSINLTNFAIPPSSDQNAASVLRMIEERFSLKKKGCTGMAQGITYPP